MCPAGRRIQTSDFLSHGFLKHEMGCMFVFLLRNVYREGNYKRTALSLSSLLSVVVLGLGLVKSWQPPEG